MLAISFAYIVQKTRPVKKSSAQKWINPFYEQPNKKKRTGHRSDLILNPFYESHIQ